MLQISDILARKDYTHQSELIHTIYSHLDNINDTNYPPAGMDVTELWNDVSSSELEGESNNLKQKLKWHTRKEISYLYQRN